MPKSKRNKIVHLTQVRKKGKDHKDDLAKQLETYCAQFTKVYIFDIDQTKSDRLTLLRVRLKQHGRIFAGRNSIVTSTLKSYGDKCHLNYGDLIDQVAGKRGLFFSNIEKDDLVKLLSDELPEFCPKLLGHANIAPKTGIQQNKKASAKKSSAAITATAGDDASPKKEAKQEQKTKVKFVKM